MLAIKGYYDGKKLNLKEAEAERREMKQEIRRRI
jgi:hypothetical protein